MLTVQNKKLHYNNQPLILKHADSPESRLKPGYEAAFKIECELLPSYGINAITCTLRGDDVTTIYPWVTSSPSSGVDVAKLQKWHDQLKYFIDQCNSKGFPGVCILYLGERTNFQNITASQYYTWIDAMAPIFEDISGNCIFGWEEIGQTMTAQQMATWANPIISYLKLKMPKCLTMIHNNPGQKPWTAASIADVMCIQETSASAMGTSGVAAFNAGYAVHLHEWYGGFKVSNSQSANLTALDSFLNQAKAETSGYGIFANDYDTGAIDATKLEYLYKALVNKLSGVVIPPPDPQPTNMPTITTILYKDTNNNTLADLKTQTNIPVTTAKTTVVVTGDSTTKSVKFALQGPITKTQTESGIPWCLFGDSNSVLNGQVFPIGNYTLTVTPYSSSGGLGTAGTPVIITFTVGTIVTPPPTTKPEMLIDLKYNLDEIEVVVNINGQPYVTK